MRAKAMNDLDYDAKQKKRIAQSARKKVGNKKGCRLPSDYLTAAQKRKLSGEVKTVNLNQPVSWAEFKALDKTMQEEYINHIIQTYHVGLRPISEMMGAGQTTLFGYVRRNGLKVKKIKGSGRTSLEMFRAAYMPENETAEREELAHDQAEPETEEREEIPAKIETRAANITNILNETRLATCDFMFKAVEGWTEILNLLCKIPLPKNAKVYIRVQEDENESQG